jgi:hypothetical protein
MLDTGTYGIEFPDDRSDEYTATVIAENMYAQCGAEGRQYNLMEGIIDCKTDGHAIYCDDMYINNGSNKQVSKTTKGWNLCVDWKDEKNSRGSLADLKESNPVEFAEYAVSKNLLDAPDFLWWVPHVLKKRSRIIDDITKWYQRRTHKFGIEVPKS